jgi:hypothetical protein
MLRRWIWPALLWACAAGCDRSPDSTKPPRYLPGWPEARSALNTALTDWRESSPPFPPSRELPGVVLADKHRSPDARLRSFTILGETDVENLRQFTVRLQFEGEDVPQLVRYNVLGRDPVWVFRLEDYEMISHWEHPMNDEEASPPAPKSAAGDHRHESPSAASGAPGR